MAYAEAFSKIKKKLSKADTSSLKTNFAIQITMNDEDSRGTFYISYIDGVFAVEPYDYRDNSVAIDVLSTDLIKIAEGKLSVDSAIEKGKLFYFGDVEALKNITGIVKPIKRVKSETEKKTEAKKKTVKKTSEDKIQKTKKQS